MKDTMTVKKVLLLGLTLIGVQVFAVSDSHKRAQAEVITKTHYIDYHKTPDCSVTRVSLKSVDEQNVIANATSLIKTAMDEKDGHIERISCKIKIENGLVHKIVFDKSDRSSLLLVTRDHKESKQLCKKHIDMPNALIKI